MDNKIISQAKIELIAAIVYFASRHQVCHWLQRDLDRICRLGPSSFSKTKREAKGKWNTEKCVGTSIQATTSTVTSVTNSGHVDATQFVGDDMVDSARTRESLDCTRMAGAEAPDPNTPFPKATKFKYSSERVERRYREKW